MRGRGARGRASGIGHRAPVDRLRRERGARSDASGRAERTRSVRGGIRRLAPSHSLGDDRCRSAGRPQGSLRRRPGRGGQRGHRLRQGRVRAARNGSRERLAARAAELPESLRSAHRAAPAFPALRRDNHALLRRIPAILGRAPRRPAPQGALLRSRLRRAHDLPGWRARCPHARHALARDRHQGARRCHLHLLSPDGAGALHRSVARTGHRRAGRVAAAVEGRRRRRSLLPT
jgi:hypothetical protein